jgi:tricorn protease
MLTGYFRFPTVHANTIVFTSEDDLWSVPCQGGVARRLTSNLGDVTYPMLSPDGEWLAFVGSEEGAPEVYVMPAQGGSARRLTYLSSNCRVVGWTPDSTRIVFSTYYGQVSYKDYTLYTIPRTATNGLVTRLPYGSAQMVSFGPNNRAVIGRSSGDPATWKRYRGGTAGQLWIDRQGDGQFVRLLPDLPGNITAPMWVTPPTRTRKRGWTQEGRIFFASDHEGVGNLYSVRPDGTDVRRHTDHEDYYLRNPSSDGQSIVYHAGADLYRFDIAQNQSQRVAVDYRSPRVQRNRRFVDAARYFDGVALHPSGKALSFTTRGKAYFFFNHDGPVIQLGKRDGVRYRLPDWTCDGRHILLISDELGEETIEIYTGAPDDPPKRLAGLDIGRVIELKTSPVQNKVALANHRHELIIVDLDSGELTVADRSPHRRIRGFDWSPDGRWLAYGYAQTPQTTAIRLYRLADPEVADPALQQSNVYTVTRPVLHDLKPAFDADGKYLYFLSQREFNPVYDGLHFDLSFPWGMKPYLITLRADLTNPFVPRPELEDDEESNRRPAEAEPKLIPAPPVAPQPAPADPGETDESETGEEPVDPNAQQPLLPPAVPDVPPPAVAAEKSEKRPQNQARPLRIDIKGIAQRVIAFPVPDGRYGSIMGLSGRALFTENPIRGVLDGEEKWDDEAPETGTLRSYNFKEFKSETLLDNLQWFDVSRNRKKLIYNSYRRLRVINAGEKPPTENGHSRKSGWIDLSRVRVSVDPQSEWEQMFREAWRLQRDHYWTPDMAEVDWQSVYQRYFPLIQRVSTRSEFSDLLREMQGELGTSHAYERGGDYRLLRPYYGQGFLGAQLTWDSEANGYRVGEILVGDPWNSQATSPLASASVDVQPGDLLLAINGQRLSQSVGPAQLLVNQAGNEVLLTFAWRATGTGEEASVQPAPDAVTQVTEIPLPTSAANADTPAEAAVVSTAPSLASTVNPSPPPKNRYRGVVVRTLYSEMPTRYRAWVEANRRRVYELTSGRIGYVHIPDMEPKGYAEFHRGFLAEIARDGLIVDVRYNSGGHVSQLILEKLARRRIGYDSSRWSGLSPYPLDSVAGPLVALTNEHAGSDGDIFCHSFKLLKLGPLVGKRTWGGVIGISPRHALVDGTVTTQPEYSFWFEDVGWAVENYGTDPDIPVDITPQDYAAGRDPQLDRAIAESLRLLELTPVRRPNLELRPSRALPKLPPR